MKHLASKALSLLLSITLVSSFCPLAYADPLSAQEQGRISQSGEQGQLAPLSATESELVSQAEQDAIEAHDEAQAGIAVSIDDGVQIGEVIEGAGDIEAPAEPEVRVSETNVVEQELLAMSAQFGESSAANDGIALLSLANPLPGSGTEADPYVISSPTDLLSLSGDAAVGLAYCYVLAGDIDLSGMAWTPIGTMSTPFKGTLDGAGHAVKNLSLSTEGSQAALFCSMDSATVKDLTLSNAVVAGGSQVAALVGYAKSSTITGIILDSCTVSGSSLVGGLAGFAGDCTISNCTNNGTVTASGQYCAGLISFISGGSLSNAVFTGQASGTSYVAGIAAYLLGNLYTCTNSGDITGTSTVGGIAAELSCSSNQRYIQSCYNSGAIRGDNEVGGIAGYVLSTSNAGFCAYVLGNANSGTVFASTAYAGGIAGDIAANAILVACYNVGTIKSPSSAGGIAGRFNFSTNYLGSGGSLYNAGNVAEGSRCGSIYGVNFASSTSSTYWCTSKASGYQVPLVGANGVYARLNATYTDLPGMRTLASVLPAAWYESDAEYINGGMPILSGVNYVERGAAPEPWTPSAEDIVAITAENSKWADPVDSRSGAQLASHSLLDQTAAIAFDLELSYDSSRLAAGQMGRGWHHNYEMRVAVEGEGLRYYSSPSAYIDFSETDTAGAYVTEQPGKQNWALTQTDGGYALSRGKDGLLSFDAEGRLTGIASHTSDTLTVSRSSEATTITDGATGRNLVLSYDASGLLTAAQASFEGTVSASASFGYADRSLSAVTDENGNTWSYSYDEVGRMTSASDPLSRTYLANTYDARGRVITQDDALSDGKTTSFSYATAVDGTAITTICDREGGCASMTFDQSGQISTKTDQDNHTTSWTYDGNGNVLTETDAAGGISVMVYDAANNLVAKADPSGASSAWTYDGAGNMLTMTDPSGALTTNTFDASNRLASTTDPASTTTSFSYGSNVGNRIATRTVADRTYSYTYENGLKATANEAGITSTYAYDARGRVTSVTDAENHATTYTYDSAGNLLSTTDGAGNETATSYDFRGNVLTETDAEGATSSYEYDANGQLIKVADALGGVTAYARNAEGYVTQSTDAAGRTTAFAHSKAGLLASEQDALGNTTSYARNARGDVTSKTSPSGGATAYAYDSCGRLVSATSPAGSVTSYAYDSCGRLTSTTDALGNITSYQYDSCGNLVLETDALGNETAYSHDSFGNLTATEDAATVVSSSTYNAANQLASTTVGGVTENYAYSSTGNLASKSNTATQTSTAYSYDAAGRLVGSTDAAGATSTQVLNGNGQVTSTTNALGGTSTKAYDAMGRTTSESTSSGGTISYTYDASGKMTSLTNARGDVRTFSYDAAGNLTGFTDADGTVGYAYDANGNLTSATSQAGDDAQALVLLRTYDADGRVTAATDALGNVTGYAYDAAGNLATLTYPNGNQVSYTYDAAGRMISVTDWAQRTTTYAYDAAGNLISTVNPDGSTTSRTYDTMGCLTTLTTSTSTGTLIEGYALTYDASGNIATETTAVQGEVQTYAYDADGRVTSRSDQLSESQASTSGLETYAYDADGNITAASKASGDTATASHQLTYDNQNRLTTFDGTAISYDADGNMLALPAGSQSSALSYDAGNRLVGCGATAYAYDALDNRISSVSQSGTTTYAYDATGASANLLSSTSAGVTQSYVYGLGLIGAEDSAGTFHTLHYDLRGSTIAATDATGAVTDRWSYTAYGKVLSHEGSYQSAFLFNGQYGVMVDGNGLLYMRARYYAPELMRFVNADTLEGALADSQTLNRYAFANGNPVSYVDPFGHAAQAARKQAHWILDTSGMIPGVGMVFDIMNGMWYAAEGDWENVEWSARAFIPIIGEFATPAKYGASEISQLAKSPKYIEQSAKQARLKMIASDILEEKSGKVKGEFPSEWRNSTLEEIQREAKTGNRTAQKAKKLLTDNRFNKNDNRK